MNDNILHPSHYTYGKIECIDYIIDKEFNFCLGNAIKYITRAGKKENEEYQKDLEKAIKTFADMLEWVVDLIHYIKKNVSN